MKICVPRRDDDGSPITELEIEKDTLDPHIIIEGESIQLRMKIRETKFMRKMPLVWTPQKFYRSNKQLCRKEEHTIVVGIFASAARQETRKYVENV